MAAVVNRTTVEYFPSVNTPDYDVADWIINPDAASVIVCETVLRKYREVVGDTVVEMNQAEKDVVDTALDLLILGSPTPLCNLSPTANGVIDVLGWNIKTDTTIVLSSSAPLTASEPGFHSHVIVDVSGAAGLPFTLRVSGSSINESSGVLTSSDFEDLAVTADGYYQTSKSWIDAVEFSLVEASSSCALDVYRNTYWDRGNTDFMVLGCRVEWTPDEATWSLRVVFQHVQSNGSLLAIDDFTFTDADTPPRATLYKPGKYKRGDYIRSINGDDNEGLIVWVDQTGIGSFYLELKLDNG